MNGQQFYQATATAIASYLRQELNITPGVHYRITEATSGPRVLALTVIVNPHYARQITGLAEQLSMAAGLDRGASVRVGRGRRGTLALEIPKPKGLWYNVPVTALPRRRFLLASVGFTDEFRPAAVDFANPLTPHALIAGTTGSGKTNAQRLIVYDLASQNGPDDVQFILIDTRKRGAAWQPFASLSHLLHPVITDDAMALRALCWAVAEIDRRAAEKRTIPRVFVGIDEAQSLLESEPHVKAIADLAGTGREFGIHLLAATQNPTAKQLGDVTIKRNLSARLVGRVDDATAAHVATGQSETGAERLTGAGDFLLVTPDRTMRLTAALLTEKDTAQLPRAETPGYLDLIQYEDVDHVLDVADAGRSDPPEPEHVALALGTGRGITYLQKELGIGGKRATRVKEFADRIKARLIELGYSSIPLFPNMPETNGAGEEWCLGE